MTLRMRLFLLVSGVIAVTVGVITWTVAERARQAFEASDGLRVAAQMMQVRREFERQGDDVVRRVERVAASEPFKRIQADLARHGERMTDVNEASMLASAHSLDILDVVADDGTLISSAEWPSRFGYKLPWAARLKAEGAFLQIVELPGERSLGLVATRHASSDSRSVSVIGGRRIDQAFMATLTTPPGMRVWMYRNLEPELARRNLIASPGDAGVRIEPLIDRARQTRTEANETFDADGSRTIVRAIPLTAAGGDVAAVLVIASSNSELAALVSRIRWSGIAIGLAGIALGLVVSYAIAARVTRPVEQLARVANEIAEGNWAARAPDVDAAGELRTLAAAFDTMTRQLTDQRDRLVQVERVAAWRELARRLAHELKNPLFPLRLTVDNLRRARQLPAAQFDEMFAESLATLDTGLSSLNSVVARFSDFSKMPAPAMAAVAPNGIVERAATLFRPQLDAPGRPSIAVALDLDPDAGTIEADAEQLGRSIQNLVLNAIDAMPMGGTLGVRTRRNGATVCVSVSDSGQGLTAEECTRLFTPYYTTKQHGTGLGLAIVQAVVADHHGKVWVESTPGAGSVFHIELPVEQRLA